MHTDLRVRATRRRLGRRLELMAWILTRASCAVKDPVILSVLHASLVLVYDIMKPVYDCIALMNALVRLKRPSRLAAFRLRKSPALPRWSRRSGCKHLYQMTMKTLPWWLPRRLR